MEKILNQLVDKLTKAYGDRLVSVVLYGSAAAGDHNGRFSDINVFCVLREVTARELAASEPIFRWWRDLGNPAPLLMGENETRRSADCFPIEFHDMRDRRRVLHGTDVVAGLEIDDRYYRAIVEHELRAKLLRLRQRAAGVMFDRDLLLRMMAESISTFCVLMRHALRLAGVDAPWTRREVVARAAETFGLDGAPLRTLLDLRENAVKPRALRPETLLEQYLKEIQAVVDAVDRL
jgi:predicted nucleotidyltransferase